MKTLLTIFTLVFTVMFSSASFAGWTKVVKSRFGDTYYVDFERIKKHGRYIYWWELGDLGKPNKLGHLSAVVYSQGDCKLIRYKNLDFSFYKRPGGWGTRDMYSPKNPEWKYPQPNSAGETVLKAACAHVK